MIPLANTERDLDMKSHTKPLVNTFPEHHKMFGKIILCGNNELDRKDETLNGPYPHPKILLPVTGSRIFTQSFFIRPPCTAGCTWMCLHNTVPASPKEYSELTALTCLTELFKNCRKGFLKSHHRVLQPGRFSFC